ERERSGLQTVEDGAVDIAWNGGGRVRAGPAVTAEQASMENFLSTGRHEVTSTETSPAFVEVHHHRPMVLGWGGGSGRRVSRPLEEVCVRAVSRSSEARAESKIRVGD